MKVVDTERVVILMRFIQYGWDEERRKRFDDDLRMMLETQCEDLEEHDAKVRADAIEECIEILKDTSRRNCSYLLDEIVYRAVEQMENLKEQKNG